MKTDRIQAIIDSIKQTFLLEGQALLALKDSIGTDYSEVVSAMLASNQAITVTGIGKSGIIAQKWVATFNSTGQPAQFLHASEAIHGDLGMVRPSSLVFCLSKSGDSPEIQYLVSLLQSMNVVLVGVGANASSYLAQHSHFFLHTPMEAEACPNGLAPTVSTTLQLAVGDALAVALMVERGFSSQDFAKFHPGGALGKKLFTRISHVMRSGVAPKVSAQAKFHDVLLEISGKRLGATAVMQDQEVLGIITDGDIRRGVEKFGTEVYNKTASELMNTHPKEILVSALAVEGFQVMESNKISQLLVRDENNAYLGIVHIHDLLSEGIS